MGSCANSRTVHLTLQLVSSRVDLGMGGERESWLRPFPPSIPAFGDLGSHQRVYVYLVEWGCSF